MTPLVGGRSERLGPLPPPTLKAGQNGLNGGGVVTEDEGQQEYLLTAHGEGPEINAGQV